jgi:uncharacterized membrane protein YfcA
MFLIYFIVGLVCGFIDSALGMGYGVSSVTILLSFGIVPAIASASIHTAEGFVDIVSGVSHWKLGNVNKELLLKLTVPGIIGAILGAYTLSLMSLSFAKPVVSSILLVMGLLILLRFALKKGVILRKIPSRLISLLGFAAAFVDVCGGGGWGPILTPTLILDGHEPRKAVGTVEITEPIISFTAVIVFGLLFGFETFLWQLVLPLMIGGFVLTPLAAYLTKKIPKQLFGVLIGVWLMALNLRTLLLSIL